VNQNRIIAAIEELVRDKKIIASNAWRDEGNWEHYTIRRLDRDREHFHTVISLSALPENLEVELDITDLAWRVQEALKDCFSQTVVEVGDLDTIYNYDS
jgi:hypothetical protein